MASSPPLEQRSRLVTFYAGGVGEIKGDGEGQGWALRPHLAVHFSLNELIPEDEQRLVAVLVGQVKTSTALKFLVLVVLLLSTEI